MYEVSRPGQGGGAPEEHLYEVMQHLPPFQLHLGVLRDAALAVKRPTQGRLTRPGLVKGGQEASAAVHIQQGPHDGKHYRH